MPKKKTIRLDVSTFLVTLLILAMVYDGLLIASSPMGLSTVSFVTDLPSSTSGFAYVVGPPLFSGTQLVLSPGSTGMVVFDCTDTNNLTEWMFTNRISAPEDLPGVVFSPMNVDKITDFDYRISYSIRTSTSAPTGTYYVSGCIAAGGGEFHYYYLTVGSFPFVWKLLGYPQAITLLLPLFAVCAIGVATVAVRKILRRRGGIHPGARTFIPIESQAQPQAEHRTSSYSI